MHCPSTAPLVFDFSRRNGYHFSVAEFDEITGRYQYHGPRRGSSQMRRSVSCIHPSRRSTRSVRQSRRRPSPPTVKGLPLDGSRDLPPQGGIIPGCRCTPPTSPTTHGRTSTTREQEAPRYRSRRANLCQKPKLGGVRALLPFHCIFRWFACIFL